MDNIHIDFAKITCISQILDKFSGVYKLKKGDMVNLTIDIPPKVYPEYLTVVVALFKYFKQKGIKFNNNVNNRSNNTYVSRINFYKELDIKHDENFNRHDGSGRFIEITNFNAGNNIKITNNIMKIIRDNCCIDDTVIKCLNYCLLK